MLFYNSRPESFPAGRVGQWSVRSMLFGSRFRHWGGSAVLGERCDLLVGVSDALEYFVGISSESRAGAVGRLEIGECERYAYGDEFADLASLIDLYQCVAVVEALVGHDLLGRQYGRNRHSCLRQDVGHLMLGLVDAELLYAVPNLLFVTVARVGGIEVGIGEPVLESERLAGKLKVLGASLQYDVDVIVGVGSPVFAFVGPSEHSGSLLVA